MVGTYRKTNWQYNPSSSEPFKLSRTKLELFLACPRCFYLDRRLGISRPSMPSFTLNNAVDTLLKKEFDIHRAKGNPHPLMKEYGIKAIPFSHEKLDEWRHNFTGVQFHHQKTNLIITGAVDDLWENDNHEIHVVDYKATSSENEVSLEGQYREAYKRQMEIYQWLMRANKFKVSDTGYFVYCNGLADKEAFDGKLEFSIKILPYEGDDSWVEKTIIDAHKCLNQDTIPPIKDECEHCAFTKKSQAARVPTQPPLFGANP